MAAFNHQTFGGDQKPVAEERRKSRRFVFKETRDPGSAGLPEVPEARVINVSRGGVLLETLEHMTPGMVAYVRLVAADAVFLLRGRVLRSRPTSVHGSNPRYESAVSFEGNAPVPVPAKDDALACSLQDQQVTYRVTAAIPRSGPDLHQIFGLNHW